MWKLTVSETILLFSRMKRTHHVLGWTIFCRCSQFPSLYLCLKINPIWMKTYPAVTYAAFQHQGGLFWITCKRPKLLRKAGRLQLIQNSMPSVALMRQCCIQMYRMQRCNHGENWGAESVGSVYYAFANRLSIVQGSLVAWLLALLY